ncbi:hypothetical protein MCHIJ_00270 [Mycolicibacterium chitae]|uniref:Protein of uncharacterized function (DUF3298) n=1 Tax=Mycolicibacterium chitae TaxID=1792 RepID=A0A3S4T2N7_MYCCI|nr:DUF3298 domain-containing protein [Mycolicibacterium chitae]BBZ00590.1 hypothetical protein MCHIJ_00270 [Mycolicibacterium chitae]VEG49439.1 Protein of uncharacterised function (DUF3298) [Mycolicibacterium chitae]
MKLRIVVAVTALGAVPAIAGTAIATGDPGAPCEAFHPVGETITGVSPDQLGHWTVRYQRVAGGNPAIADAINGVIDAEARGQVATYEPSASKTTAWTLDVDGKVLQRPVTISTVFTGEYGTDLPNMPIHAVATRVFDCRSGILIDWDNLFVDKKAGLARLSEQTAKILPTVYAPPSNPGRWQFGSEIAPVDANYRYWVPTGQGIELHFPDGQFGRGVAVITVPWPELRDLIAPEFQAIAG